MAILFRAGLIVLALIFAARLPAQEIPTAADMAYRKNDVGIIYVEVTYATDGKVESCRIVRSNAPYQLEASTIKTIEKYWKNPFFAGDKWTLPIYFQELPANVTSWNDDLVAPPNLLPPGDTGRSVKLRIVFGDNGWVNNVAIVQSSGLDTVDRETAIWVKVHWHHGQYANKVIDAPFEFRPTPPEPAPVVVEKPKPVPAPRPAKVVPAAPAEPEVTPAVRVQ